MRRRIPGSHVHHLERSPGRLSRSLRFVPGRDGLSSYRSAARPTGRGRGKRPGSSVLCRTVEEASGWYGFGLDLDEAVALLAQLREDAHRYQRPAWLGELEISVAPGFPLDRDTALRFAELGVHRLILLPPPCMDASAWQQWVKTSGEMLVGQV